MEENGRLLILVAIAIIPTLIHSEGNPMFREEQEVLSDLKSKLAELRGYL